MSIEDVDGPDRFPLLRAATSGFILRPFEQRDAPAVARACNDAQVQRWLPLPSPYGIDTALEWCCRLSHELRERSDGLHVAMATKTGRLIGSVSLKHTNWRSRCTEIGYWTVPDARNRGHTSAAVSYVSQWALAQGMERVELRAAPKNHASRRVARKAGFVYEGTMRNAGFTHAGRVDLCLYSLIPGPVDPASSLPRSAR